MLIYESGFIQIYQVIENSDEAIHELYFKKYKEFLDYNKDTFYKLLENSLQKFPNNQFLRLSQKT